jgi:hypothetical protein
MSTTTPAQRLLRASDEERNAAVVALSEHFAAGRLDHDEFERRMSAATSATYVSDLDPLFGDLPAPHARPAPSPLPAVQWSSNHRGYRPPVFLVVLAAFLVGSLVLHGFSWWLLLPAWWLAARTMHHVGRRRRVASPRPVQLGGWYAAAGPGHRPPWCG